MKVRHLSADGSIGILLVKGYQRLVGRDGDGSCSKWREIFFGGNLSEGAAAGRDQMVAGGTQLPSAQPKAGFAAEKTFLRVTDEKLPSLYHIHDTLTDNVSPTVNSMSDR
jgi:hypothetical protein